ncbi:hypothetical protein J6590_036353 [Homalodisca vitripennis]|nr:hypothetical protein J6590_036353 [Homalodisca vitripennis]
MSKQPCAGGAPFSGVEWGRHLLVFVLSAVSNGRGSSDGDTGRGRHHIGGGYLPHPARTKIAQRLFVSGLPIRLERDKFCSG